MKPKQDTKKPWGHSKSDPPIKYIWETSIPNSWIKIKGKEHFQHHQYQLSYDTLPSLSKTLPVAAQPSPQPLRLSAKRVKKPLSLNWSKNPLRHRPPEEDLPDLVLESRRDSISASFLITGLPSLRGDGSLENSSIRNLSQLSVHTRSTLLLPTADLRAPFSLTPMRTMPTLLQPASSKLHGLRKLYRKVVIANPEVNVFMNRFEKKRQAKVARVGRRGFAGQKISKGVKEEDNRLVEKQPA